MAEYSNREPQFCPTCGSEVAPVGGTTKHYEPVREVSNEEIRVLLKALDSPSVTDVNAAALYERLRRILP